MGRVESWSTDTISIKPEGNLRVDLTWLDENGVRQERYYQQDNNQPVRTFRVSDRVLTFSGFPLPGNRLHPYLPNRCEHSLNDLRVGDRVDITFGTIKGAVCCTSLTILRRPGGRVPDALGDGDKAYKMKVSTQRNIEQCVEETIAAKWGPRLLSALKR